MCCDECAQFYLLFVPHQSEIWHHLGTSFVFLLTVVWCFKAKQSNKQDRKPIRNFSRSLSSENDIDGDKSPRCPFISVSSLLLHFRFRFGIILHLIAFGGLGENFFICNLNFCNSSKNKHFHGKTFFFCWFFMIQFSTVYRHFKLMDLPKCLAFTSLQCHPRNNAIIIVEPLGGEYLVHCISNQD